MKIFTASQIRRADQYTIIHEPIASIDLMERAAQACVTQLIAHFPHQQHFTICCGPGNNGGDGLAMSRLLLEKNFEVSTYIIESEKNSTDHQINYQRLLQTPGCEIKAFHQQTDITPNERSVLIDCLLGTGVTRPVEGELAELIQHLNQSFKTIISIDVPSGMHCDEHTIGPSINASETWTFQWVKKAFLFPENHIRVGDWSIVNIGLSPEFEMQEPSSFLLLDENMMADIRKPRDKFAHKGNFGHALIIAGSKGKMGAAVIAARACLRSGVGLLTCAIPERGEIIMQTTNPEAMVLLDVDQDVITQLPDIHNYKAIGIGPGLGTDARSAQVVKSLLQTAACPLLIDADALNCIAHQQWQALLPKRCILTPHVKEFERLFGTTKNDFERHQLQIESSIKYGIIIVLKGAHTCITTPEGLVYFNNTGNPGLAKGGSGDLLSGIITAYLAQGYTPQQAALLGVYDHGHAADLTAQRLGQQAMLPTDL
ncbi:MAG: NAD(P)H-hydrate dehydratase [Flavobacteriales bacterium]